MHHLEAFAAKISWLDRDAASIRLRAMAAQCHSGAAPSSSLGKRCPEATRALVTDAERSLIFFGCPVNHLSWSLPKRESR